MRAITPSIFKDIVTEEKSKNSEKLLIKDAQGGVVDSSIYLQFGRCASDEFSLDVRWPFTPLEAFAIALSTFDAYDGN